jgi:hypothetical protein
MFSTSPREEDALSPLANCRDDLFKYCRSMCQGSLEELYP